MSPAEMLRNKAAEIRKSILAVAVKNGAGHIAPSLSCVEILVALYYRVMNYRDGDGTWPERDRLVFSKGHGAYALYAILADKGVIPWSDWEGFYTERSTLVGCAERNLRYGIEASCGALGHGLPMAVGLAFGAKVRAQSYHTYCIVGDGETQEGATWEAIQFAVKHELDNLTIVVDRNRLQAMDFVKNIMDCGDNDLQRRMEGFGLQAEVCPGHDTGRLVELFTKLKATKRNRPALVIAETVKGAGCPCMENVAKFHFRIPSPEELRMGG
ncbi:MAG: transketolase [Planctomycetota bacterium]|nr:transketolase [Planctomycetota bacterium]